MLNIEVAGFLTSLQHADSFFPSGALAFSWGLESLIRDGIVTDATTLNSFVEAQIVHRWISFDQGILSAAWHASKDWNDADISLSDDTFSALLQIDRMTEAMTLPLPLREGSRRLGLTLMNVHTKLGTLCAIKLQQYLTKTPKAKMPHLLVAQGYLGRALGMSEAQVRMVSAHTVCTAATSAAVRLGIIGYLDAQLTLARMHLILTNVIVKPAPDLWNLSSAVFTIDIAALRHVQHDARLFAN